MAGDKKFESAGAANTKEGKLMESGDEFNEEMRQRNSWFNVQRSQGSVITPMCRLAKESKPETNS